jgi:hypothetical protein
VIDTITLLLVYPPASAPNDVTPSAFMIRSIHPNPAVGVAMVEFDLTESGSVTVELVDAMGRRSIQQTVALLAKGANAIRLPLAGIPPGAYTVVLRSGGARAETRLVVLH